MSSSNRVGIPVYIGKVILPIVEPVFTPIVYSYSRLRTDQYSIGRPVTYHASGLMHWIGDAGSKNRSCRKVTSQLFQELKTPQFSR